MEPAVGRENYLTLNYQLIGIVLLGVTILELLSACTGAPFYQTLAGFGVVLFGLVSTPVVSRSRVVFLVIGVALFIAALASRPDWQVMTQDALKSAAFIAAFFTALTFLRNASQTSPSIEACGRYLAEQPPGRRYAALTVGGHLFSLILNYGAISLLGGLAEASARREPNEEIRNHRIRRMLLAIQRGFVSMLPWSPLTFAVAISTSLVPGAKWVDAAGFCAVSGLIFAGIGWAMDTIFKPRLTVPAPVRAKVEGSWTSLLPLLGLLLLLTVAVAGIHMWTGLRAVDVVMLVVPFISAGWIAMQNRRDRPILNVSRRTRQYVLRDLSGYREEIVLLTLAGFIGTLGSKLLSPMVAASGVDLTIVPGWVVLVSLVWIIPIAGQIGMNPILSVSLIAPLLPEASAMSVSPAAVTTALTAGWSLCGASSPYTATTLLVGHIARLSAWHVGLVWNGAYTLVCALALSAWVAWVASL